MLLDCNLQGGELRISNCVVRFAPARYEAGPDEHRDSAFCDLGQRGTKMVQMDFGIKYSGISWLINL